MKRTIKGALKVIAKYIKEGEVILTPSTGAIPEQVTNYYKQVSDLLNKTGVSFQTDAYNQCPQIQGIVSKKSQALIRGNLIAVDSSGNSVDNRDTQKAFSILKNPNKYQNYTSFLNTLYTFQQVYGVAYVYKIKSVGFNDIQGLLIIPNNCITVIYKPVSNFLANNISEIISHYEVIINGMIYRIDDLSLIEAVYDTPANTDLGGQIKPKSRIDSLKQSVVNIVSSIECRGEYITNHGADIVISPEKGDGNILGLGKTEREEIQRQYAQYGAMKGQYHALISETALKIQKIGRSIVELGLFDGENQDHRLIASNYGVPIPLLSLPDTSKYSTYKEAKTEFYEDTIIPESKTISAFFDDIFKPIGWSFSFDFSNLQIMQKSESEKATTAKLMGESLKQAVDAGFITQQEATEKYKEYI